MILMDSPEAAQYREDIKGWVSKDGYYYGEDERTARYRGCTHVLCQECQTPIPKNRLVCDTCYAANRTKKYLALPAKVWDGEPVVLYGTDRFFWDMDEFYDWCEDNDYDPQAIELVFAQPVKPRLFGEDDFELPEELDCLPIEIQEAVDNLNQAILRYGPLAYEASGTRVLLDEPDK